MGALRSFRGIIGGKIDLSTARKCSRTGTPLRAPRQRCRVTLGEARKSARLRREANRCPSAEVTHHLSSKIVIVARPADAYLAANTVSLRDLETLTGIDLL